MKTIPIPTADKLQLVLWALVAIACQVLAHLVR